MSTGKILIIVFCALIAVSAVCSGIAFFQKPAAPDPVENIVKVTGPPSPEVTVVKAADQSEVTRPTGFPDPEENMVKLPETDNLAEGKEVTVGVITDVYIGTNAVDGDPLTYWESGEMPAEFIIDLAKAHTIKTVGVRLNPAAIWSPRTQAIEVLGSTDGKNFTSIVAETGYDFDPGTGNAILINFDAAEAQYVKLIFSSNTGAGGAQAGEIMIYE